MVTVAPIFNESNVALGDRCCFSDRHVLSHLCIRVGGKFTMWVVCAERFGSVASPENMAWAVAVSTTNPDLTRYQNWIGGSLPNRIDTHIDVTEWLTKKLIEQRLGESSKSIRVRMETAREPTVTHHTHDASLYLGQQWQSA